MRVYRHLSAIVVCGEKSSFFSYIFLFNLIDDILMGNELRYDTNLNPPM